MCKFKIVLGCGLFLMAVVIHAQTIVVGENASIKAQIPSTEITRIAVEGDRIRVLRGVEGAYSYTNDTIGGAVFLKPSDRYQSAPFYLFISTEQGHNYVLQLHPTSTLSAGMLVLKPKFSLTNAFKKEPADSEWSTDPPQALSSMQDWQTLIQRMAKRQPAPNEKVIQVTSSNPILIQAQLLSSDPLNTKPCQLELTLKSQYVSSGSIGEIYEVHNPNAYPVHLSESLFYRLSDRAISLKTAFLPANGKTELYKIREGVNHA